MGIYRFHRAARLLAFALLVTMMTDLPETLASSTSSITLRVSQSGFAGVTGTEYNLASDGKWQATNFIDAKATGSAGSGQLTVSQVQKLSGELAEVDFQKASMAAGTYEGVNPAVVELLYGERSVRLNLPPGYTLGAPCPFADVAGCQILGIAQQIELAITSK